METPPPQTLPEDSCLMRKLTGMNPVSRSSIHERALVTWVESASICRGSSKAGMLIFFLRLTFL